MAKKTNEVFLDRHGDKVEEGMTLRHNDGEESLVYMADEGELGFNASNEHWLARNGGNRELYPLHQFDMREYEIVNCERCEKPAYNLKTTSNGYSICGGCWNDGEDRE